MVVGADILGDKNSNLVRRVLELKCGWCLYSRRWKFEPSKASPGDCNFVYWDSYETVHNKIEMTDLLGHSANFLNETKKCFITIWFCNRNNHKDECKISFM